jgi:CheY-like chemotaxis protein
MSAQLSTVLVVDDDGDIREGISAALADAGYAVAEAADGAEALAVLDRIGRPSLILLDLMMPVMDGYDFLRALADRGDLRGVPVCVMTASRGDAPPGATQMLRKPFGLDALLGVVERLVASARARTISAA